MKSIKASLILSQKAKFGALIEHSVLAMIASQKNEPWHLDVTFKHKIESGLTTPPIVRMKLFTLENRLIL